MGEDCFGLRLVELVVPSRDAQAGPEPSEGLLVNTLAKLAPDGAFSLRYIYDPARSGELQVALLGRARGLVLGQAG